MSFDGKSSSLPTLPMVSEPSASGEREFSRYEPNALSHSRLKVLQACPRRFYIEYEKGMERIGDANQNMRMGAAFAKALQFNDPKIAFTEIYQHLIADATNPSRIDDLQIESATVEYYATKYIEIYGECDLREVEYSVPLENGHSFRGAVDGFCLPAWGDKAYGVEDKLFGRWTEDKENNLPLDPQITSEIYGLRSLGHDVTEIRYRVNLKPRIVRKKGRGKMAVPETVTEYVSRFIELIEESPEEYFFERVQSRSQEDLEKWHANVIAWTETLDSHRELGKWPTAVTTCDVYKNGCAHREICNGIPSAMSMYQKKEGYPE